MSQPRRQRSPFAVAGIVLVVLGIGLCLLWRVTSGSERHSFDKDAIAPVYVHVTKGESYSIAVPDGVHDEIALGLDPTALRCTINRSGGVDALTVSAESADSKATNQIASFVAPVSGSVHVACAHLDAVFIDDADDAGADYAGLFLLLGIIALTTGIPLGLSALRAATSPRTTSMAEHRR